MADALDLGSGGVTRGGSSPPSRTTPGRPPKAPWPRCSGAQILTYQESAEEIGS